MAKRSSIVSSLVALAALACLVGGCGPGADLPCLDAGEALPTPGPDETRVAFTLTNKTCMSICVLLLSPDRCEYMGGVNWLEDQPLRSMESVTLDIPPGKYAAWVELCTEEFRADEHLRVYGDTTHEVTDPKSGSHPTCDTSLTIVNESDVPICEMRIGTTESVYTGWNWLGSHPIEPGDSLALSLRPDTYFIRAEGCDDTWLRAEVDVPVSGHQTWIVP